MFVPVFCGGISMSKELLGSRFLLYPKSGILKAIEQSNVPLVIMRRVVGVLALATEILGEYPPLATTVTICFPPETEIFSPGTEVFSGAAPE